jgi:phosphoribosyl 1,2-cyclic phosphodiesterase
LPADGAEWAGPVDANPVGTYAAPVRLILFGVRGSTPSPGPDFVRYGGHTSCVGIVPDGATTPTLVLDAGTGLRELTPCLAGEPFRGSILVSHLHWDHVQGLPFFAAGDRPDAKVDLYVPAQNARTGRDLLAASMAPPNFPITPEGLEGEWTFTAIDSGYHTIEGFRVRATEVQHKGGRTFGYRISDEHGSMAYIPDHVVSHGIDDAVRDLVLDVDVLLHDAQFLDRERPTADNYGHSTVEDSVRLARECGARHLVLFHHSPARKDEALDEIAGMYPPEFVTVATQGAEIDVRRP